MPSIPQSLLWLSLVVLWLFVLVPMLVSKRDAVRRTSDVALATRVLNSATAARLIKRGRPAAGHRSDPDWQPEEDEYDEDMDDLDEDDAEEAAPSRVVTVAAAVVVEETAPDYLDFDVVDPDSAELPLSASAETDDETADDTDTEVDLAVEYDDEGEAFDDDGADQYEYIDDTSGIPIAEEPPMTATPAYARRHRYDADTAAAVSARKFAFRRRMLMIMALMLVGSAATAFLLTSSAWWFCGIDFGGDRALPGLPAQADPDRGAGAAPSDAADGAVAARCGEHLRPRVRRGAVAVAAPRSGGSGDRRRRPDLRASRLCAVRAGVRLGQGLAASGGAVAVLRLRPRLVAC